MKELGVVTIITVRSHWANDRVERFWNTLQSRLSIRFKRNNICTLDEANAFFQSTYTSSTNNLLLKPRKQNVLLGLSPQVYA